VNPDRKSACWVLSDGAAGNEKQALALAKALGFSQDDASLRCFRLEVRAPWRWFSPHLLSGANSAFDGEFRQALESRDWPELAIGCGRQAALATRLVKRESRGATRVVQILDPRIDPACFDLVVAPRHDGLQGANVATTRGALNAIDDAFLADAKRRFAPFAQWPAPRTVLLLGGPTRALPLDHDYWNGLASTLETLVQREGGSLSIAASRRTPDWLKQQARLAFASLPGLRWYDGSDGGNPYDGLLAWADRIVVTPDSVNMLSEAAATPTPLFAWKPEQVRGKLAGFISELRAMDRLRPLDADAAPWNPTPLRELDAVAARARTLLG